MDLNLLLNPMSAYSIQMINNPIVSYLSEDMVSNRTRYKTHRAGASCRLWQFIFGMFDDLQNRGYGINQMIECATGGYYSEGNDVFNHKYDYIIELMIYAYKYLSNYDINRDKNNIDPRNILYRLIFQNEPIVGLVYDTTQDGLPLKLSDLDIGNNYMCFYMEGESNSIIHYFNIIKISDDECYVSSSYGSESVCVPPYTTRITPDEFEKFIGSLTVNDPLNNLIFEKFYDKFFLRNNLGKDRIDEDTIEAFPEKKWEKIGVDEGIARELNSILTGNRGEYRIGSMPGYQYYIHQLFDTVIPMYESNSDYAQKYIAYYGPFTPFVPCAVPGFGQYVVGGKKKQSRKRKTIKKNNKNKLRKTTKRRRSLRSSKRCSR
jgi:hypothetical protein